MYTRAPALQQEKSLQWETYTLQLERNLSLLQLQKACMWQQRPSVAKNKLINFKKWMFYEFTSGPVVKSLPSNVGDAGLIPGRGTKVPYGMEHGL